MPGMPSLPCPRPKFRYWKFMYHKLCLVSTLNKDIYERPVLLSKGNMKHTRYVHKSLHICLMKKKSCPKHARVTD